jgi:hypothetical protein
MQSPSANTIRRTVLEWSLLLLALLLLAGPLATWRWRAYDTAGTEERRRLELQAHALSDHLDSTLHAVDNALVSIRVVAEAGAGRSPDFGAALSPQLTALDDAFAAISNLQVLDADGGVLAASASDTARGALADQPCFKSARARSDPDQLYVCEPFRTQAGSWTMDVLRTLQNTQGEFQGVVAARLDSDYLSGILPSALYADDMRALLMHANGVVIASGPGNAIPVGTDVGRSPGNPLQHYRAAGQTSAVVEGIATVSHLPIVVAFRAIEPDGLRLDKPLLLALSRTEQAVYRPWRVSTGQVAFAWLLVAAAGAVSLRLMQRRRRLREAQDTLLQKRRLEELERIELVVSGADLSLWLLHLPEDRIDIDARWCAMLGCAAG